MNGRARPGENKGMTSLSIYLTPEDFEEIQDWREEFVTTYSDIARKCIRIGLKHKNELFKALNDDQQKRKEKYGV